MKELNEHLSLESGSYTQFATLLQSLRGNGRIRCQDASRSCKDWTHVGSNSVALPSHYVTVLLKCASPLLKFLGVTLLTLLLLMQQYRVIFAHFLPNCAQILLQILLSSCQVICNSNTTRVSCCKITEHKLGRFVGNFKHPRLLAPLLMLDNEDTRV